MIEKIKIGLLALIAVLLGANAWYLRVIERQMPSEGPDYETKEHIRQMNLAVQQLEKSATSIERNTRR